MSLFKHPQSGVWFLDLTLPNGKRIKRSTKTKDKKAAQEYHDKVKHEAWRMEKLGERPEYSFDDAALMYLKSCEGLRDYRSKVAQMRYWVERFSGQPLRSLTTDVIMDALPTHKRVQSGPAQPMSPATKNRYLATISKLLTTCAKRGWIDQVPQLLKFEEAEIRESFLTPDQANALLEAMGPGWMQDISTFALATGMRAGEILSLEWAQVDTQRKMVSVLASKAKSGSGRPVPLNDDALAVIERRRGTHHQFVFARAGVQTFEPDRRVLQRALKKAGLPASFRFHDFRHTWASWHAQAGTPLLMLQRAGGWKTLSMLNRYAHLNADHLAQMAATVQFRSSVQFSASSKSEEKKGLSLVA